LKEGLQEKEEQRSTEEVLYQYQKDSRWPLRTEKHIREKEKESYIHS
jgi:hypothetical protein